ncbi:DUF302 domain-containing protein [Thiorhodococcus mannitoliphagus]|uniref:DUF302 domain-containing protein n=1 Tax=Thiorhodococcus mannitoliphagus TaxID=329406 RepID=A0A6P1DN35_9GAMM|nr:DUF302 domain-containing protein [Thiorhodococcus mannitoliphagus]NEX19349.1 DUF302 domain-containing protein [Thiorhodococcus mannitoliphagus]
MMQLTRALLAVALVSVLIQPVSSAEPGYARYSTDAPFEDVMDGLRAAIQERGLYINEIMDMAGMLQRTGEDLGLGTPAYTQAKSVQFCSAILSHEMTIESPVRIVNCPFIISVYEKTGESGTTYVAHREISAQEQESSPAMRKVAKMLKDVAEAAIAW